MSAADALARRAIASVSCSRTLRTAEVANARHSRPPKLERFKVTTLALRIGSSINGFSPEEARAILPQSSVTGISPAIAAV